VNHTVLIFKTILFMNLLSSQGVQLTSWKDINAACPKQHDQSSCGVFMIEMKKIYTLVSICVESISLTNTN